MKQSIFLLNAMITIKIYATPMQEHENAMK